MAGSGMFVTLTYSDLWCPDELKPEDLKKFMYRLRQRIKPAKLRFFGVGEYGDLSWRPHYHLAIFPWLGEEAVKDCWPYGMVHIGLVELSSIRYITGYCTKSLTTTRSVGKRSEFVRMSLRPGIGAGLVDSMPLVLGGRAMADVLAGQDVPQVAMVDGKPVPIGTYLRRRLRLRLGRGRNVPGEIIAPVARSYAEGSKSEVEVKRRAAERSLHGASAEAKEALKRAKRIKL